MKKLILFLPLLIVFTLIVSFHMIYAGSNDKEFDYNFNSVSSTLLDSNLFTQVDDKTVYVQEEMDMDDFEKTIENEDLTIFVNNDNFAIRILNNKTGYIWTSDAPLNRKLNSLWTRRVESPFIYTYRDIDSTPFEKSLLDSFDKTTDEKLFTLSKSVDENSNKVTFNVDILDTKFRFSYTLTLDGANIHIALKNDTIEEYGTNRLTSISFYQFFGAVRSDYVPGYYFIPSGNGALVRFEATSPISSAFPARFYGQDLYYSSSSNSVLNYPVFGGVHGIDQNGYFVNVTDGAEFAEYKYEPTGFRVDYHRQFATFNLRESYAQKIPGSNDRIIIEKNLKQYDIGYTITILSDDDANYVGMAKVYKAYLINKGILHKISNNSLGVHLDVLGSDYEKGLFFKKNYYMTTTDDILNINKELTEEGVDNLYYTLRSFNKGGNTDANYQEYKFDRKLGDIKDLNDLDFGYYYNPTLYTSYKNKPPKEVLKTINNMIGEIFLWDKPVYQYYIDIAEIIDHFPMAKKDLDKYGGMALDGLSNKFYSNRNNKRNEMYAKYDKLLDEPISMYNPNQIMLKDTSKYLTTPINHDRFRFFTDNVPFIQIVLSGYVPAYSEFLNFSANMNMDILKVIDYGINPAYLITWEQSHLLSNTYSNDYYATYYGNLKPYIIDTYHYVKAALADVYGEEIISRDVISEGVVKVGYANGIDIIINYTSDTYEYEGQQVNPQDYLVGSGDK